MRQSKRDLEAIRDSVKRQGEFRLHVQYSRSGLTVKAHMWHHDGFIVGSASGGGYDKTGAAVGEAISRVLGPDLLALKFDKEGNATARLPRYTGGKVETCKLYGVRKVEGKVYVDGACGIREMERLLNALGFVNVENHSTKDGCIIVAKCS